jgi:hypothetical protein
MGGITTTLMLIRPGPATAGSEYYTQICKSCDPASGTYRDMTACGIAALSS